MERLFILLFLITLLGCLSENIPPDLEAEKEALMVLHNNQRKAHMEKNVELLLGDHYDDFVEVNRGFVRKPTREESTKRLQSYFDAVDFIKWDDVSPPVFSFSDDGTMATSIVDKIVILKLKEEDNRLDTTYFAWLAVYKKDNGKWHLHRIGSTNR